VLDDPGRLEVLLSANAMKAGMAILGPLLAATGAPKQVKMVICAIKGNIYDIGKEPGGHDDGGCRFRRDRPRHQQSRRELFECHRGASARHHRHVRTSHHDYAETSTELKPTKGRFDLGRAAPQSSSRRRRDLRAFRVSYQDRRSWMIVKLLKRLVRPRGIEPLFAP
jgi:hypothetical protein